MSCDPEILAEQAKCLSGCLTEKQLWASLLYIQCNGAPTPPPSTTLLTDISGYWKHDETGAGTRVDASVNGNNLTDVGNLLGSMAGVLNNCSTFDGSAQLSHVDTASLKLGANSAFSVSAWFNQAAQAPNLVLVDKGSAFDLVHDEYLLYFAGSNTIKFAVGNGTTAGTITSASLLFTGIWYHVLATYDPVGQNLHLYVNGVEDVNSPQAWTGGTAGTVGSFSIGASSAGALFKFNGGVDEFGFWKRTLPAGAATALYGGGTPPAYSTFGTINF